MAEARKVVGWFYRNGKRIPIFEKRERDVKEGTYQGKSVTVGSEVDVPGGKDTVQRLYETSNPDLMYKNRIRVKNNETGDEIDMANGDELNPKFGKTGLRKPLSANSIKVRDRKSRNEILDYDHDAAKAFEGLTQVATPREVANDMGKRVRTGDGKIVRPVKRSGIDMETRVNKAVADDVTVKSEMARLVNEKGINGITGGDLKAIRDKTGASVVDTQNEYNAYRLGKTTSGGKAGRGGKGQPRPKREKADPTLLDANVPKYLKASTGGQTPSYEGKETAFTDSRGDRQWAKNVASLPEKKRRFSNGYSKLGSTEARDIYVDRDSTNGDYYATPRKPGGTGGVGGRSPRPGIRYSGKTRGEAALKKNVKTAMGRTGRRRDGIHLPQEAALADKKPGESYIKYIMEERGLSRADAIKFIMDKRKGV